MLRKPDLLTCQSVNLQHNIRFISYYGKYIFTYQDDINMLCRIDTQTHEIIQICRAPDYNWISYEFRIFNEDQVFLITSKKYVGNLDTDHSGTYLYRIAQKTNSNPELIADFSRMLVQT